MIAVALKGLLQRKLRALLTALAVVLGVAMVSGTFMLTDSIQKAFDSIFATSYAKTDVVVSGKPVVEGASSGNPTVPAALVQKIRALPGVDAAAGSLADLENSSNTVKLLDADGKVISTAGAPNLGFGFDPSEPQFIPLRLTDGDWAHGRGQVVIDAATAEAHGYRVGDSIRISAYGTQRTETIAGIATYGDVKSLGGATLAAFDLRTAGALFRKTGYDSISVAARSGTPAAELVREIRPLLPADARVESSAARAQADSKDVNTFIDYLRYALLAFGGVALFVGAFVIFNTLSITIAQRTREFATLRTLGASRRQVLRSVIMETLAVGTLASLIGLGSGFVLARGLSSLFATLGMSVPETSTVVATRTVVVSLAVGILVTLVAGLVPALRATRVNPIESVREGAAPPPSRVGRRSGIVAALVLGPSAAALAVAMTGGASVQAGLLLVALGAVGLFVGIALVAPRLVRPLATLVGAPGARLGGVAGRLARGNATRNPGRTAATAAALMIGLTLVTTVAVLGQGMRESATSTVDRQITADYVVTADDGFSTVPAAIGKRIASVPGIETSSVRSDKANAFGSGTTVTGLDSHIADMYRFRFSDGTMAAVAALQHGGAIVRKSYADEHHVSVGEGIHLTSPSGKRLDLRVGAVLDQGKFDLDPLLGSVMIGQSAFDASFPRPADLYTFITAPAGSEKIAGEAIAQAERRVPGIKVLDRDQFVASRVDGLSRLLNLLYVLLALSVVVSLFGMINTLVLSVFERTRELGMLRTIGLTRRQTRRMIRHESIVTALIGAALGLPLGIGLAAAVTQVLSSYGIALALPVTTLVSFVVVAIAAGVVAAVLPARRAGRLNVLDALQYE
jgi:putative ABC transport system permease protein